MISDCAHGKCALYAPFVRRGRPNRPIRTNQDNRERFTCPVPGGAAQGQIYNYMVFLQSLSTLLKNDMFGGATFSFDLTQPLAYHIDFNSLAL